MSGLLIWLRNWKRTQFSAFRARWQLWIALLILEMIRDRGFGWLNSQLDTYVAPTIVWVTRMLDWLATDPIGPAGMVAIVVFGYIALRSAIKPDLDEAQEELLYRAQLSGAASTVAPLPRMQDFRYVIQLHDIMPQSPNSTFIGFFTEKDNLGFVAKNERIHKYVCAKTGVAQRHFDEITLAEHMSASAAQGLRGRIEIELITKSSSIRVNWNVTGFVLNNVLFDDNGVCIYEPENLEAIGLFLGFNIGNIASGEIALFRVRYEK